MKYKSATVILVLILLIYFAIELASGAIGNDIKLLSLGAIPDSGYLQGEYWRLVTYSLLHADYVHLILNAGLLYWVGRLVERRLDPVSVFIIYAAAVILSGTLILLWKSFHPTPTVTIGASSGVFGLLGASIVLLYRPSAAIYRPPPRVRALLWLILSIGIAVSFLPGISFVGHLTGLVSGALAGYWLPVKERDKNSLKGNSGQQV